MAGFKGLDVGSLRQFKNLELLAKSVVEGFMVGLHKSPFHGFSVEFAEHRLYNQGESTRYIDWKLFGRTDKYFLKRYEEETNLRCHILLDISSSMYFPQGEYNKMEFAVYCGAAMIYMLRGQRDACGLTLFSDTIDAQYPARSSTAHSRLLFSVLEGFLDNPTVVKQSGPALALNHIAQVAPKRGLIVVLSDMIDNTNSLEDSLNALRHLKYNGHEVMLFHILDKSKELEFNFENRPLKLVDMETGQQVRVQPNAVKEAYVMQTERKRALLKERCESYRIDYIEADIAKGFEPILLPYLVKRLKMH